MMNDNALLFFKFQHVGTVRFKWMDSKGTIHEQAVLGEGKCNDVLKRGTYIDSGLITEKYFLPIKQVLYGPMPHANQQMKITVDPVRCTPSAQSPTPSESNQDEKLKIEGEIEVKKNNKLPQVFKYWGKEYSVKFDIEINKEFTSPEWLNVFHMTSTDNKCCNHGDRIPALFVNKNKNLLFASSIGNQGNYNFYFPYELNKTYHIVISQTQSHTGNFEYCIKIDGIILHSVSNDQPIVFENVLLYFSNPWHTSLGGYGKLSNIEFNNLSEVNSLVNDLGFRIWKLEKENEETLDQLEQLSPCPLENSNFRLIHGRCIYFESQQLSYGTARSNCKGKAPGFDGKLFEPTNIFINEKVHEMAMEVFGTLPVHGEWLQLGHRLWIGLNDQVLEGNFRYDQSKTPLSINAWLPAEPSDNGGNEDCVEFGQPKKPLWNDNDCSVEQLSICEFVPTRFFGQSCPTENPNYRYIFGHCYFFESQELDFDAAQANCGPKFPRGGQLFEPTSRQLNEKVSKEAIKVTRAGRRWVGVHDKKVDGTFKYASSGQTLSFTPLWQANNPSNSGGGEDCIEVDATHKWNDNKCERQFMSICESK